MPVKGALDMGQEHQDAPPADGVSGEDRWAPLASRGDWSEEAHTRIDIHECTTARCMNVDVNVGFQGLAAGSPLSPAAAVGEDLRAAWRAKLDGEGKVGSGTTSLRDLVARSQGPGPQPQGGPPD